MKWAVLNCKMSHFTSHSFVKKIQVLCLQCFKKSSYFAHTRPSDFYFEMMAFSEGKNGVFVKLFQISSPLVS